MFTLRLCIAADRFAVSYLGFGKFHIHAVARLYLFHEHFDLDIALTAEEYFARFRVLVHGERVVLLFELGKPREHFILLAFLFRRDRHKQRGFGEVDRGELYFRARIAKGVAGVGVAQLIHRADIACREYVHGFHFLAAEQIDLSDTFFTFRVRVPDRRAAL